MTFNETVCCECCVEIFSAHCVVLKISPRDVRFPCAIFYFNFTFKANANVGRNFLQILGNTLTMNDRFHVQRQA